MLLVAGFVTTVAAAAPDALFAIGLKVLTEAVVDHERRAILLAAFLLAGLVTGSWLLGVASDRVGMRLSERSAVYIESYVARLQSQVATIEHHERPDYLDRLALLRDHAGTLSQLYRSLFIIAGSAIRLVLTVALLMSVRPVLGLLALFAVPTVLVSNRRAAAEKAIEERGAQGRRRARHLFVLGSTAAPGKEVRVSGVQGRLRAERREAWERSYRPLARARWISACWQSGAWALFAASFVAAIGYVAWSPAASAGGLAGDLALVLAAGSRLSNYVSQTVSETHFLRSIWLDASRRMAWLEDYAAACLGGADLPVPDRLRRGITFDDVSFRYPGTDRLVLDRVTLHLPAGKVVAVVGENGAGKTTLVKLLCRFYDPTSGRITIDGADLARIPPAGWRDRLAGAFQDFFRFEYRVQRTVGLGDRDRLDDRPAVEVAIGRAGAGDVVDSLTDGLATQLGVTWRGGVEVSFGQWQKLALARGFMRDEPLLLVLDEPTAALDAEMEHALFERYAAAARSGQGSAAGRITVLVSHRFSTVRMADLIVVLDGAQVVEHGSHEELMERQGRYAELYNIQAAAYR
jgi:ATP-binding cassette subfamily B protein